MYKYLKMLQPLDIDDQPGAVLCEGEEVHITNAFLFFL